MTNSRSSRLPLSLVLASMLFCLSVINLNGQDKTDFHNGESHAHSQRTLSKPTAKVSAKEGRWSDPRTWGGAIPTGAVVIPSGQTVWLDINVSITSLQIDGTLIFLDEHDIDLSAKWIMVNGKLQIGTADVPYQHQATITLNGNNPDENVMGMGTKVLCAMMGGTIELHGAPRLITWTKLSATASPGEKQIMLERAPDWKPGERIVIASTDFDPHQAEEVTIKSVIGQTVVFEQALRYQHWGAMQQYGNYQLDQRAEVGLLSHNIIVQGDASSATTLFGGHIMVMNGSHARVQGVEMRRLGQEGRLGRYGFHWHLAGDNSGDYFLDNSLHHLYSRGVVVHGTSNTNIAGNVLYDFRGHGFAVEDGIERNNIFYNNLGLLARVPRVQPNPQDNTDLTPAVFWIKNPNNVFRRNVAAGSEALGFWYDLPEHPTGPSATNKVWPREEKAGEFSDNVSHSNIKSLNHKSGTGLWVDGDISTRRIPISSDILTQRSSAKSIEQVLFRNLTVYKSQSIGAWLNNEFLIGGRFSDNKVSVIAGAGLPTIESSLVVCLSNNSNPAVGIPTGPGDWGDQPFNAVQLYDGNLRIRNSTFANCRDFNGDNNNHLGGVIGFSESKTQNGAPYTTFSNVQLINSNVTGFKPAFTYDPDNPAEPRRTIVFRDLDGTLTGTNQPSVITYNNPLQLTNGCSSLDMRTQICSGANDYLTLQITNLGGARVDWRRDDNAISPISSWVAPNGGSLAVANVLAGTGYTANIGVALPEHVDLEIFGERAGQWVRMSLPYPHPQAYVYPNYNYSTSVASVNSMGALNASNESATYFRDTNNSLIHIKLLTKPNMFQVIKHDINWYNSYYQRVNVCARENCQ